MSQSLDEETLEDQSLAESQKVEIEGFEEESDERLEWDEKARQLMRQILTQKVDLPISRIRQMIDDEEIDLAPGFQRRLRWTRSQQSRLIESVIMNVPIPPVFLGEDQPGRYVVLVSRLVNSVWFDLFGSVDRLKNCFGRLGPNEWLGRMLVVGSDVAP